MSSDPLNKLHNQLLGLQNALEASNCGFMQINDDDSLECDATCRALLGLGPGDTLEDLSDLLFFLQESQQEGLLDQIDSAKVKNEQIEIALSLENTKKPAPNKLLFTAQAARLPGAYGTSICGTIREITTSDTGEEKDTATDVEQVRSANVELANFASIASHDMREPLRMITSYLRLLQERPPETLDDRARRYIDYACEGADRMRNLLDDLLSYARLDKTKKEFEPLALEDILATSIDNLSASIRDTKAEVTVAIDHAPVVMGDKVRLTRLFQNLIANGIKFKKPDTTARVTISFADGEDSGNPGKWIVSIKDHGIGIDPDHHEMLFTLFQRLNTRDEFDGSGIGLAVCKKIAEQHGGRIWFDSANDKGSTFHVALDKADAQSLQT